MIYLSLDNFPLVFSFNESSFLKIFGEAILILSAVTFLVGAWENGRARICQVYLLSMAHRTGCHGLSVCVLSQQGTPPHFQRGSRAGVSCKLYCVCYLTPELNQHQNSLVKNPGSTVFKSEDLSLTWANFFTIK